MPTWDTFKIILCYSFVGGLTVLHIFFTTQNITTYEHFRSRYSDQGNPYDRGLFRNWYSVCCKAPSKRLPETLPYRVSILLNIARHIVTLSLLSRYFLILEPLWSVLLYCLGVDIPALKYGALRLHSAKILCNHLLQHWGPNNAEQP